MENKYQCRWKTYEVFLKTMIQSKKKLSQEKPENEDIFNELKEPFLWKREDVGEIIVYPPELLRTLVKEQCSDSEQFIDFSFKKGLLKTNKPTNGGKTIDKTLIINMGGDSCRTYSFIVSRIKELF